MPKILIIEDDPDISAIERDYLELSGYEVSIQSDGTAGLAAALSEGMSQSLWPILGLFTNLLAVLAFLIVRDDPRRRKAAA